MDHPDESIIINGANRIDLLGGETKQYKITLLSLKATNNTLLVTFTNPQTGEFIPYKLSLTFTNPDILDTLELLATVRETTSKLITINNPLSHPVTFKSEYFIFDNDNVSINPKHFTIPAQSVYIIK